MGCIFFHSFSIPCQNRGIENHLKWTWARQWPNKFIQKKEGLLHGALWNYPSCSPFTPHYTTGRKPKGGLSSCFFFFFFKGKEPRTVPARNNTFTQSRTYLWSLLFSSNSPKRLSVRAVAPSFSLPSLVLWLITRAVGGHWLSSGDWPS